MNDYTESVTVVNRVQDAKGQPVPYNAYVGGEILTIRDKVMLPPGLASIAVHGSAWGIDKDNGGLPSRYKLGVPEWDLPVEPLLDTDIAREIDRLERIKLHEYDKTRGQNKFVGAKVVQPVKRSDPVQVATVRGNTDGVSAAGYGDGVTK